MDKTIDKIVRHADYSEKAIERYLAARVKELGGLRTGHGILGAEPRL